MTRASSLASYRYNLFNNEIAPVIEDHTYYGKTKINDPLLWVHVNLNK